MPHISSIKKKDAKPSKNCFKNRESVALKDDISVYEKSAELAKKIRATVRYSKGQDVVAAGGQLGESNLRDV